MQCACFSSGGGSTKPMSSIALADFGVAVSLRVDKTRLPLASPDPDGRWWLITQRNRRREQRRPYHHCTQFHD